MSEKNSVANNSYSICDEIAAIQTLASMGLSIHPERCVRLRNRHATCARCAKACTSGAIDIKDNAWNIDPSLCVQCGTCATVCPTCALEATKPHDADLLRAAKRSFCATKKAAVFACAEFVRENKIEPYQEKVVELECLSRLDETMIFSLAAEKISTIYALRRNCKHCARAQGCLSVQLVQETVATIARVFDIALDYQILDFLPEGLHIEEKVQVNKEASASEEANERASKEAGEDGGASEEEGEDGGASEEEGKKAHRNNEVKNSCLPCSLSSNALVDLSEDGQIKAQIKPVHVGKDSTLPHFVPARRRKLLDILSICGKPREDVLDTRLWGHVIIDFKKCKSCKMCAVFCPTGALCKYCEDKESGIEHYMSECVHCCLCQDICPASAITCSSLVPAHDLASGKTERYRMPDPEWMAGPNQILSRMRAQITGNSVEHSY